MIRWRPDSFMALSKTWNDYWRTATFEEITIEDSNIHKYKETINSIFVNGGMLIKGFSFEPHEILSYYFSKRVGSIDKSTFFLRLFSNESIINAIPEYQLQDGLVYVPMFKLDTSYIDKQYAIDQFKAILLRGGAYHSFIGTKKEATNLAYLFCNSLFGDNYEDNLVFYTDEFWNGWFYDVAWDYSWIVINRSSNILWVISITDTD